LIPDFVRKYKVHLLFLFVIIVQAIWIAKSDGFYFIDDSCHFNYNRHFIETYNISIGAWHRVGRVWLFALPSLFGLKGVQIASGLLFLLTIYFSYKILKIKEVKYAEWVIPLIAFQPVLFNISYTVLAELPAAFLIVLAYYYHLKGKFALAMVCSSLIFIFRTEYFFIAGIFLLIYLFQRKWKLIPLFFIGPFIWFAYSTIISLNPAQFFNDMTLHTRLPRISEGIDWYYYLLHSAKIFGVIQILFFAAGLVILALRKKLKEYALVFAIIIGGIGLQTLLAFKGLELTCSVGQLRYVALVGPMIAIVSVIGISSLFQHLGSMREKIIISIFLLAIMFVFGPFSTPFHNKFQIEKDSEKIASLVNSEYKGYMVLSNLYQVANALDQPASGGSRFQNLTPENIRKYDKSIIVWEQSLETSPFFLDEREPLKKLESNPHVKLIESFQDTVNNCYSVPIYAFRNEDYDSRHSRELIDYLVKDQTSWENIDIKVFVKE